MTAGQRAAGVVAAMVLLAAPARALARSTTTAPPPQFAERTGQVPQVRIRFTINEGWRFAAGDVADAQASSLADTAWAPVTLPHTWNATDALAESPAYRRGIGWYRKRLELDPALRDRRLFLYFEGANQVADVFVNGQHAGRHVGGYTAFVFDVTALLHFDRANTIAVRVDNRHDDDIPPLNADFTFYGGLYRDVWLVATSSLHIAVLDHASPGVFIDTPEVSADQAAVRVRGTLVNHDARPRVATVSHRVLAANGAELTVLSSRVTVPAGGTARFEQVSPRITRPRLWSPEDPYLYRVITEVAADGTVQDRTENPLGFRWFRIDAEHGFELNGQRYPLYGTNRHQDRPGLGNALPDDAHRADVALVKATGFNFLRLAHYPQDPALLEALDRQGLIGWEEIPVVNTISLSATFADNAERMLVEMIRQHYNHPAIVFWGYMNEVLLRKPSPLPEGYVAHVRALAARLDSLAHAEDPTRATAIAISFDEIDDGSGVQDAADVLGLNLYFGWYYRTLEGLGPFLDSLHVRHPRRPLLISEYGAGSDERIHTTAPRAFDFSTEHHRRFHEATFPQIRARDYLVGSAVWNQFDFGSAGRHDSKPNINQKGLFYFDRRPKDSWHYYRAVLLREPVLHIATRDWLRRAGSRPEDARQPVTVYSSQPVVELLANGTSLGHARPQNGLAEWSVSFRPGANRLEARADGVPPDVVTVQYEDRTSFLRDPASSVRSLAVNAGAHYQYVDAAGTVWEADRAYAPGGWGYVGGTPQLHHHRIAGTDDDALYQSRREGASEYRFDVADGEYEVRLRFAELLHDAAGERVFDVRVNQLPVFTRLDLAADFGRYTAVERVAIATAEADSGITVGLVPRAGTSTLSAILLRRR